MSKLNFLVIILFIGKLSFSQLNNFTFDVTTTDETCLGNGSLNFNVSNTTPGATMTFNIYLLPNNTNPLATITTNSLTGLNEGDYLIIATQSLGEESASKQQNATILNQIQDLTYILNSDKVKCGNDGIITVNITSGVAVSYQILTGPVTTPLQSSNVFSNLPTGVYGIRVYDNCGDAVVQSYTLEQAIVNLDINGFIYSDGELPSCNSINILHFFNVLPNEVIAFPLNFTLTVIPPGGGTPISFNQIISSGSQISHLIPFYEDQLYQVNLQAIDACGNIYNRSDVINQKFYFLASTPSLNCTDLQLVIEPKFYVSPYTVEFLSFPLGFNPSIYNSNHPGPFSLGELLYGSEGNSFPEGNYTIQLTDACGRTAIKEVSASIPEPSVSGLTFNDGCGGGIIINISNAQMITVNVINAPTDYTFPLPHDISLFISPDGFSLILTGIPAGDYTFQIIDSCGVIHELTLTVLASPLPISVFQFQSCNLGIGSIGVYTSGAFTSVTLINAPSGYTASLPQNLNANIVGSSFLFGPVNEGFYTFLFTNNCGVTRTEIIFIEGYEIISNISTITPRCGSFDLYLEHESNSDYNETFWLQKFNPSLSQWQHPATGVGYIEGNPLDDTNAIALENNFNNLNFAFTGQFRVLKSFTYIENVSEALCIDEIYNFNFSGGPQIINVTSILCTNTTNQVTVDAIGLPPLSYRITSKNGIPFNIDNGTSNIFIALEPAIYNFQVQDQCGNIVNSLHDITPLETMSITASSFCDGEIGSLAVEAFPFLNYEWWKADDPSTILSTNSTLNFSPYNSSTDFGLYYVRITNINNTTACVGIILEYEILKNPTNPSAGNDQTINYCGNQGEINLNTLLSGNFDINGSWSEITTSGTLNANVWNSTLVLPGTYIFKYLVLGNCDFIDEAIITINIKETPKTAGVSGDTLVCENASINLFATLIPNAIYQWSGPNGFTSNLQNPIINNATLLNAGTYTVVTILDECESLPSSITINVTPLPQLSAGADNSITYCGHQGIINLYDLILGNYDLGGIWQEVTGSGNLSGNLWQSNGLSYGTYQFKYIITGECNFFDESLITIHLNEIPQAPLAFLNGDICENSDLQLNASSIPNAIYQWSGPNGFTSNLQNPLINNATLINNGLYTVIAIIDGCQSPAATVNVSLSALPQFTIEFSCINNVASLNARSLNNSYNEANVSYIWTNGSGYYSTTNPAIITGQERGFYTLTITDVSGCQTAQTVEVLNTLCSIPSGISPNGDGKNDTFDLSGLSGILNVQIFNRWGMLVYEKDNYINEWYGQLKNTSTLVPTGTYFYIINFASSEAKSGWVYLMREKD